MSTLTATTVHLDSLPAGTACRFPYGGSVWLVGPASPAGIVFCRPYAAVDPSGRHTPWGAGSPVVPLTRAETGGLLAGADATFQAACTAESAAARIVYAAVDAEDAAWHAAQHTAGSPLDGATWLAALAALDQRQTCEAAYHRSVEAKGRAYRALEVARRADAVATALQHSTACPVQPPGDAPCC